MSISAARLTVVATLSYSKAFEYGSSSHSFTVSKVHAYIFFEKYILIGFLYIFVIQKTCQKWHTELKTLCFRRGALMVWNTELQIPRPAATLFQVRKTQIAMFSRHFCCRNVSKLQSNSCCTICIVIYSALDTLDVMHLIYLNLCCRGEIFRDFGDILRQRHQVPGQWPLGNVKHAINP